MKTRLILPLIFLLFPPLFFAACKKDPTKNAKLPSITQEGKNTIGFTIGGEVWVPYYNCRFMGDPCGEIHSSYSVLGGSAQNAFDFNVIRYRNNSFAALTLTSSGISTITSEGEKIDSIRVEYNDNKLSGDGYFVGPNYGDKFIITKIDFVKQIISGQFEFRLKEIKNDGTVTNNFIKIVDGRFDFKFNACKCSQ